MEKINQQPPTKPNSSSWTDRFENLMFTYADGVFRTVLSFFIVLVIAFALNGYLHMNKTLMIVVVMVFGIFTSPLYSHVKIGSWLLNKYKNLLERKLGIKLNGKTQRNEETY